MFNIYKDITFIDRRHLQAASLFAVHSIRQNEKTISSESSSVLDYAIGVFQIDKDLVPHQDVLNSVLKLEVKSKQFKIKLHMEIESS